MATAERRRFERFTVEPMYSSVEVSVLAEPSVEPPSAVRRAAKHADGAFECQPRLGHAYDLSLCGVRFELDEALPRGARTRIEIMLPGCTEPIRARGRIVRVFDAVDDPGPRRMAIAFERFEGASRTALARHLADGWLRRAPVQVRRSARSTSAASASVSRGSRRTRSASAA